MLRKSFSKIFEKLNFFFCFFVISVKILSLTFKKNVSIISLLYPGMKT